MLQHRIHVPGGWRWSSVCTRLFRRGQSDQADNSTQASSMDRKRYCFFRLKSWISMSQM